jgi:hypothetical protein
MRPRIQLEAVMNARTTEVCWDSTLVRVEYLDEAGNPYYCCFNARAQPPTSGAGQDPGAAAKPPQRERAETPSSGLVVVVINVVVKDRDEGVPVRPACRS